MRFFSLTSILLLLVFMPSSASASIRHGCAPLTPPAVSGTRVQPSATHGTLFINEVLLNPGSTWNCSEFKTYSSTNDAWIEIYNAQNQPLDLYSANTSIDSGPNTNHYFLRFGTSIAPYGFLIIFPRVYPFFQATETQTLRLLIGSTVIDEVTVPLIGKDQSYARIPDGSPNWFISSAPTIDASNTPSVVSPTSRRAKAEATARATQKSSKSSRGGVDKSGGNSFDNGSTSTNSGQQQVDGVQPSWSSLKHPDALTVTPPANTQSGNAVLTINNNAPDVFHKILLTVLAIALTLSLFWCWHLFRSS